MYKAYLCFPYIDDEDDGDYTEVSIVFEEPHEYKYQKVVPISFSVLQEWTGMDQRLYK